MGFLSSLKEIKTCTRYILMFPFSIYRAEELEIALMEMVKQDNRRQLSAKVTTKLDVLCC